MLNQQESNKGVVGSDEVKSKIGDLDNNKIGIEELKAEMESKKEAINIHSMPSKFVGATQKASQSKTSVSSGAGKKVFLGAIALILVLIIVIAGVIFIFNKNKNVVDDANQIALQNSNEDSEEVVENTNTNVNENVNSNTNENTNTNTNVNENVNSNTNENTNTNTNVNEETNFDIDNDGLSYEEELVFGTNPNLEDTDKDGYKDAQEIVSLFNPLLPAKYLITSGLVVRFHSSTYNYMLLRPKTWVAKTDNNDSSKILIIPNSETGELFTISSSSNTEALSLSEALVKNESILGLASNFENYSLDEEPALRSKDGRNVICIYNNNIHIISYDAGFLEKANFDNIFEMLLNSFEWFVVEDNSGEDDE